MLHGNAPLTYRGRRYFVLTFFLCDHMLPSPSLVFGRLSGYGGFDRSIPVHVCRPIRARGCFAFLGLHARWHRGGLRFALSSFALSSWIRRRASVTGAVNIYRTAVEHSRIFVRLLTGYFRRPGLGVSRVQRTTWGLV